MKKRGFIFAVLAAVAVIAAAGCSNEVDNAIKKLGGSDTEKKEAIATIMSIPDSKDRLDAAIMDAGPEIEHVGPESGPFARFPDPFWADLGPYEAPQGLSSW